MGILNVTPNSFSDGGCYLKPDEAIAHAETLASDGADIIDLGGESTKPGAKPVDVLGQLDRVLPVLKAIRTRIQIPISIDTTRPEVAIDCLDHGADIINDVSGLHDGRESMGEVIREFKAGLILMHRRGDAETMQKMTGYADVVSEVIQELEESLQLAWKAGVERNQIVLDPGLGFSKTAEQSIELLKKIDELHHLGYPLMVGASRKSFLGSLTGREIDEREFATSAASAVSILKGVSVLRVHNVKAAKDVALVTEALQERHSESPVHSGII